MRGRNPVGRMAGARGARQDGAQDAEHRRRVARRWLPMLAFAALAALAALPGSAQVDTSVRDALQRQASDYQDLLEERRAEIARIEDALGATRAELEATIADRDQVSARIGALVTEERDLEARIVTIEAERDATQARIADEEANLDSLRGRIRALLVNLHRQRTGRAVNALAGAESLHDLRVKNVYLSLLSRQDVDLVAEIDAQLATLSTLRDELDTQLTELASAQDDLAATRIEQESARARLDALIAELDATEAGQQAQRADLMRAQQDLEAQLADIERDLRSEIARLEEEERRLRSEAERFAADSERRDRLEAEADRARERILALTSPQEPNSAGFVAPLEGGRLLSTYGEGNNSFVSLRAQAPGAPVYAVQGGVVIAAQSIGANDGWMLAIRHDSELTTVYTNLVEPPLQVGDRVQRGQVVGFLGGGTLPPPDVLRLYARLNEGGREAFVDPLPILGL